MKDFLQQTYLDNTLQSYCIVGTLILIVFLFKRYIAHYVASFFFFLLRKRYRNLDKVAFKSLIAKPLGLFIATFITVAALDKLNFPEALDIKIYRIRLHELLRMMGTALIIITFTQFLIKTVDFIIILLKECYLQQGDSGSHQLVYFFKDFIKVLIGLLGGLLLLKYVFHYDVKGLVTGLSIVGAAVALALKESLENLIASFIIFFDKPFKTGDSVKGSNFSGVVEKIGLRSTRIRTDAKTYITVPNKQMVDSVLDNLTNRTLFRGDIKLEIEPETPLEKVQELLKGIREIFQKHNVRTFSLYINDISSNAIIIVSDYYASTAEVSSFPVLKNAINVDILQLMKELGIHVCGRTTNVSILNEKPFT